MGSKHDNGGLFDLEEALFLSKYRLPDWYLARVLDQLGRASSPDHPTLGLFRVDYRDLAIQQLGSVYEGLLELKPRYAAEMMRVVRATRGSSQLVIRAIAEIPRGYEPTEITYPANCIYLATDKGERRRSGSYYTPDHIVEYIVERALGKKCTDVDHQLTSEIREKRTTLSSASSSTRAKLEAELAQLEQEFDQRIMKVKILDPAMGSGHFLIKACQYLAEEIATNPHSSDIGDEDHRGGEATITLWKRRVAEHCLYGVDFESHGC